MEKKEITEEAFKIIAFSGDAFDQYYKAVEVFKENNIVKSKEHLQNGDKFLNCAHQIQTCLIQEEVNGKDIPYSLVMTHAQDHLTKATNWQVIVNLLLK
ncbi:MAG: PTS lactose/cellobiose transporter subunit IIA [Mycoplasmatales bacterium]